MYNNHKKLDSIQAFQLFCIENFRSSKQISGLQALKLFQKTKAFDYLASGYEVLHTQSKYYILSELEQYIQAHHETVSR